MTMDLAALRELIGHELQQPLSGEIRELVDAIHAGRPGIAAILFYGSGLWKLPDAETVFDFYVLIDRYRVFDGRGSHAVLGRLLPPNVYYLEHGSLRCKYAVIRIDQFRKAAAGRTAGSQIWARFAQPARLVYARDRAASKAVVEALSDAVVFFHTQSLALLDPAERSPRNIWLRGFEQTYGNEWRSEEPARAEKLYAASREALDARSNIVLPACQPAKHVSTRGYRRISAKAVYFLQLLKAVFTFDGGVDYALWKIERQSGVKLVATDFQKRHPLISAWPLVWRAWRSGALH